jgi:hypothetical protein
MRVICWHRDSTSMLHIMQCGIRSLDQLCSAAREKLRGSLKETNEPTEGQSHEDRGEKREGLGKALPPRRGTTGKPRATPWGKRQAPVSALKGRDGRSRVFALQAARAAHPRVVPIGALTAPVSPFQGEVGGGVRPVPRALPWAFLFRPVGARRGHRTWPRGSTQSSRLLSVR